MGDSHKKSKRTNQETGITTTILQEGNKRNRQESNLSAEEDHSSEGSSSAPQDPNMNSELIQAQQAQIELLMETVVRNLTEKKSNEPTRVSTKPIGLYGETNAPASLASFPLLTGNTALHYSEWVRKCTLHFTNTGLREIITLDPQTSFNIAVAKDNNQQSVKTIKMLWQRLMEKAYVCLIAATEPQLGREIAIKIEREQEEVGEFKLQVKPTEGDNEYKIKNLNHFKYGNANYYWELVNRRVTFTQAEKSKLYNTIHGLRFKVGWDPQRTRSFFIETLSKCQAAGIDIDEAAKTSIWVSAIPPQLNSLSQVLSINPNLTWEDVYNALYNWYQSNPTSKPKPPTDTAMTAGESGKKPFKKKHCTHCKKVGHTEDRCFAKYPSLKKELNSKNSKDKSKPKPEEDDKPSYNSEPIYLAPAVEGTETISEMIESLTLSEEVIMSASDKPKQKYYVFDSAATSHMTPYLSDLQKVLTVPEVQLTTALKGATTTIRQRGCIRLNDKWLLSDVANVPNG